MRKDEIGSFLARTGDKEICGTVGEQVICIFTLSCRSNDQNTRMSKVGLTVYLYMLLNFNLKLFKFLIV